MKIELTIEIDELNNAFALATAEANASEDEANDQDVPPQRANDLMVVVEQDRDNGWLWYAYGDGSVLADRHPRPRLRLRRFRADGANRPCVEGTIRRHSEG